MKKLPLILALLSIVNEAFAKHVDDPKINIVKQYDTSSLTKDEFIQKYGDTNLRQSWTKQANYQTWVATLDSGAITECGMTSLNLDVTLDDAEVLNPTYRHQMLDKNTVKATLLGEVNHKQTPFNSANFIFKCIGSQDKTIDIVFANGRHYNQNVKQYCHR